MLCLGNKVGGHPVRTGISVANYNYFGRTSHHIDTDLAKYLSFCLSDKTVARSSNLVDSRNGFCSICQGGYGLSSPYPINPVDRNQTRSVKQIRVKGI